MSDISERIRSIVHGLMDPDAAHTPAPEEFDFSGEGPLDSVWALQLVVALEKEFGISVEDIDVTPENFQNLSSLTRFVMRKIERVAGAS